ncbi:aldehyde dehydrogenase [Saitoella complicata NRRL Y-17804]|uniref:Aldehyde dehydrogenase n=1 Tax=Saitoella complicata (strain BCRC 22490 / CBS 7301 / JCM 7358 / NBRC 10748 / NRRL Y-17804) TaxID=698492 RepID=A0A0E9NQ38_SAICN|nr:aldehyde dehydrogenase [Saitoella complicata NRRL Y-17804]ODQ54977.1 aldehyde dehydrogenase [Saitoella complicata NRRL Y-17804]GAO51540.1 hypothetical protein G7K_5639-t1 [Saitoella complicata NRRL Y-17804]
MAAALTHTPVEDIPTIVSDLHQSFHGQKSQSIKFRIQQLRQLYFFVHENHEAIVKALKADLAKPEFETYLTEIGFVEEDVLGAIAGLESGRWQKDKKVPGIKLAMKAAAPWIKKTPMGVVLIIGAWNYPLQLVLCPFVGALAAGNCVVLKPSELSPHTAQLLAELFPKYMDQSCYRIVNGAIPETTKLLDENWDKIMYTGNSKVARIIAAAAAKNLTPTILELGGKNPTIVTNTANIPLAATRIAWGKFMNCGQTCLAPDYVLAESKQVEDELVAEFRKSLEKFYGEDDKIAEIENYGRIVNDVHCKRIAKALQESKGTIAFGGHVKIEERFIAPTIVTGVTHDDTLMSDEIFGPVLPIVTVNSVDEAVQFVNKYTDTPLALYIFSDDKKEVDKVLSQTRSGGVTVNDTIQHAAITNVPFGGVGESGMGAYRGQTSFDAFSHDRVIAKTPGWMEKIMAVRYPPYLPWKFKAIAAMAPKAWFKPGDTVRKRGKVSKWVLFAAIGLIAVWVGRIRGVAA